MSTKGRVKNKETGVILTQIVRKDGYLQLRLRRKIDGLYKNFLVHRLVAITYIKNKKNKREVNHKDGYFENNNKSNLEWVTTRENVLHAHANGFVNHVKGVDHPDAKLTPDIVRWIRKMYKKSQNKRRACRRLAKKLNRDKITISSNGVRAVVKLITWKHVA